MKAIFCGNFEYDARQSELERLFKKYGKVDRVDMKSGFAFIYMEDERDGEDAIRGLDRYEFGRQGRRLRVEWTKQERGNRRTEITRKPPVNSRPTKTLFVINFDPYNTRTRDLERHFDVYGKILNVRIRRNFAFIQFESQEDATKALEATNLSKLMDRVITVEYAVKDDDDRRNARSSPDRGGRDRSSPPRRGGRSPSPYGRERGSPDYGHGRGTRGGRSSVSPYGRSSPDYGRGPRGGRSPSPNGRVRKRSPSPLRERERERERGSRYSRDRSSVSPQRKRRSVENGNGNGNVGPVSSFKKVMSPDDRAASPEEGERLSPGEFRVSRSSSPRPVERVGEGSPPPERYRSRSPLARERERSRSG